MQPVQNDGFHRRCPYQDSKLIAITANDSGIVNDANLWATETMGDASYPLKLFQRVITVSLETTKIVRALPRLDIQTELASER